MPKKENMTPIADLHCDLLAYLGQDVGRRGGNDPESQCSIPQLKKGGVVFQALPIFTETQKGSSRIGADQFFAFQKLLKANSHEFRLWGSAQEVPKSITVALAIENASELLEEDEPFELCLKRIDPMLRNQILYVSLTWNDENRFGGGNASLTGLKEDGKTLLDFLGEKRISIDLSHTSDQLAYDILDYIDKKKLKITPLASHSNFRKIKDVPRNLPDEIAREIIRRKGVIGINFLRGFVGTQPHDFLRHLEHAVHLGGKHSVCFGADFFAEIDARPEAVAHKPFYFPDFDNSSCYPEVLKLVRQHFQEEFIMDLAHRNFEIFLKMRHSFGF